MAEGTAQQEQVEVESPIQEKACCTDKSQLDLQKLEEERKVKELLDIQGVDAITADQCQFGCGVNFNKYKGQQQKCT